MKMFDFLYEVEIKNWNLVEKASIVCLVGLFCLPGLSLPAATRQLARARQAGKLTMLDTGWDPQNWPSSTLDGMRDLLAQVSLFMPNWDEARAITREETVEGAALRLQEMGPQTVVFKCGELGSYARRGSQASRVAPRSVVVHDAVGAGDVFNSGFLFALLQDWPLEACLALGNTSASLYISRQSDRFPRLDEVKAAVRRSYPALSAWSESR